MINNNLFYTTGKEFIHMLLDGNEKVIITNNIFHYPNRDKPKSGISIKVQNSDDIFINNNIFSSPGIGIYQGLNNKNLIIKDNNFSSINPITKMILNEIEIYKEVAK